MGDRRLHLGSMEGRWRTGARRGDGASAAAYGGGVVGGVKEDRERRRGTSAALATALKDPDPA